MVSVGAPLRVLWIEVMLVGLFAGIASFVEDRTHNAAPGICRPPEAIQFELAIPDSLTELATLEQQLTALRAQAIASGIEVRRRRTARAALEQR
jgi:hypothetical protein